MAKIHPTAIVDPSAVLADDVEIGPFCVIGAQVEMGAGCRIGPHAVVNGPTLMGRENRVFQFASIGEGPQDLSYQGEPTRLEIGDRNHFREGVTVHRGTTKDRGITRIGSDNIFLVYSQSRTIAQWAIIVCCPIVGHCRACRAGRLGDYLGVCWRASVLQNRLACFLSE